ncbi:MAG: hypothetical protein Q4D42_02960 [Eubacteriales bacterium]|nr:hypothetical protein [Eubacteriales bacterium]
MDYVDKICQAGAGYKEGSLEAGITEMLLNIAGRSPAAAELIAQDLRVKKMSIAAAAKHLTDYARKNKSGNGYYMTPKKAEELLRDFYKIPDVREEPARTLKPEAKKRHGKVVDLLDFL